MNRYVCRNCGKFVSKDATVCKSCGCENPVIEKVSVEPMASTREDGEPQSNNTKRKLLGIIVILIIGFNIYRACSDSVDVGQNSQSADSEWLTQNNDGISQMPANIDESSSIVFKVIGTTEPCLMWVIKSRNGKLYFEQIAVDNDDKAILKSGPCVVMTFGQLKSQAPNTVIRNCAISADKKILLIGPVDTHYNSDYSERPIYGILVASKDATAQLFINDTDEENVFILLDNLEMQVK